MFRFDYAIKPKIMIVGDIEFSDLIRKASIFGLGYISIPQNALVNQPLKIALIFNNEEYGRKAMLTFHNWINSSNGNEDAFMMDIIERKNGGYVLCFYQGIECLINSNIPNYLRKWVNPIIINVTQFKEIDHVSGDYIKFKNALQFSRCHIIGGTKYEPFTDIPNIVKTKINIYTEDNIPESSPIVGYKALTREEINQSRKAFGEVQQENLDEERDKSLKYFFPITYEKIRKGFLHNIIEELEEKHNKTQIMQGICNLILQFRIEKDMDIDTKSKEWGPIDILEYLMDKYESPRSFFPNINEINKEVLVEQINADSELLRDYFTREE